MREADLYPPLKAYLEGQGYEVKSEIGACDIMARRGDDPPVIVEMKLSFSLALVLQGVARQGMFDVVYLATPIGPKGWPARYKDIIALCRRLGLGLLAVKGGAVEAHLDPAPYAPRKNAARAGKLLREFDRRVGDPNMGGTTGIKRMTHYRQDALRVAQALANGPLKARDLTKASRVSRACAMARTDHYGWFFRPESGIYALTDTGRAALISHCDEIAKLLGDSANAQL
jgi:hypothetical protein